MQRYERHPEERLAEVVANMISLANSLKGEVKANLRGVTVVVKAGAVAEDIIASFKEKTGHDELEEWPPNLELGKSVALDLIMGLRHEYESLMLRLANLDFNSHEEVLDWFSDFQDPSTHVGVKRQTELIVDTFATHGYFPGTNVTVIFKGVGRDAAARHITGLALAHLQSEDEEIPESVLNFIKVWRERFLAPI